MSARRLHLLREVLDHEVVDVEGTSCGIVDDIELSWGAEGPAVTALLLGPGAWVPRMPKMLQGISRRIFGTSLVRIPWSEVTRVSEVIHLRSPARAWGAGALDERIGRWMAKLPMT